MNDSINGFNCEDCGAPSPFEVCDPCHVERSFKEGGLFKVDPQSKEKDHFLSATTMICFTAIACTCGFCFALYESSKNIDVDIVYKIGDKTLIERSK